MDSSSDINRNKNEKIDIAYFIVPVCLIVGLFVIFAFTGKWPSLTNPYNSYALQAKAWLEGNLHLVNGEKLTHLELAIFKNQYFVSFPPFPSYVMLPFVLLLGLKTPDHYIAIASYLMAGIYAVKICKKLKIKDDRKYFYPLFLLMASNIVVTSANGWVWFIAQNFSLTLSLMSIYYALQKKGGLSLTFWACSVGCRPMQIVYLPILIVILIQQFKLDDREFSFWNKLKEKWYWIIGPSLIAFSYMILNVKRFGNIVEFGHNYLPEFTEAKLGQFNIGYISKNLPNLFRLPFLTENGQLDFYYFNGVAFWLISPIMLVFIILLMIGLVKNKDKNVTLLLPFVFLLHLISIVMHKTLGGWHFGNRYLNDLLPFVFYGVLVLLPKKDWFTKLCYPLFFLGLLLNYAGAINMYYPK